jgi:D-glycerate 3-kinase
LSGTEDTIRAFILRHRLPDSFRDIARDIYLPLIDWLDKKTETPLLLGINGCQGSGKSTLADFIAAVQAMRGRRVAVLSIDDFYLTRRERAQLAQSIHPLLQTRGVPGTHDLALALQTVDSLLSLSPGDTTQLPRFDKSRDDRAPLSQWPTIEGPIDMVILEGWCVGSRPQSANELTTPVNTLEKNEDADGRWRQFVNDSLKNYQQLFERLHTMVMLKAPDFSCVYRWRLEQEQKLAALRPDGSGVMSAEEIARFIQHYQRLTEANLVALPSHADVILELNHQHGIDRAQYS